MGVEIIKRQARAAYGSLVAGQRLYARSVCDTKAPLQLRLVALCKCYMPLPFAFVV